MRSSDLETVCDDSLWIEVKVKIDLFSIGLFYSPSTADVQFFNSFNLNIENALEHSKTLIKK